MYIENAEGFDGEGDLFSKFGVELEMKPHSLFLVDAGINLVRTIK
jgi:hypothetical protein